MICFLLATYFSLCIILRIIIEKRFPEYNAMIKGFLDNKLYYLFHILHHIFYLGYCLLNVFIVYQLLLLLITNESFQMYPKLILMISAFIFQFPLSLLTTPDIQRIMKIIQMIFIIIGSILYIFIDLSSTKSSNTTEELIAENKECPTINYNQITQFICYSEHSLFFGFVKDKLEG